VSSVFHENTGYLLSSYKFPLFIPLHPAEVFNFENGIKKNRQHRLKKALDPLKKAKPPCL
jgi:hypothetical protein